MPQVSVSADSPIGLDDLTQMPDPLFQDNFDLRLIEGNDTVCRAAAPIMDTLRVAISDVSYVDNGLAHKEENGYRGALTIDVLNVAGGQDWVDGTNALIADLDAIEFDVFAADGSVYSTLRFTGLAEPEMAREFNANTEGDVQTLSYAWSFTDVQETVKEAQ